VNNKNLEPIWLDLELLLAVHEMLLARYGGSTGIREKNLLESELDRPKNLFIYEQKGIFDLAASYAEGITNNHPFIDGNKRSACMSAILFLETNGYFFEASEESAVEMVLGLSTKKISRDDFARWLKDFSKKG